MCGADAPEIPRPAVTHYAKRFLPDYEVLYIDDGDGDRITPDEKKKLAQAGIALELGDAMPDVLLVEQKGGSPLGN
jgi:hypothetical protein